MKIYLNGKLVNQEDARVGVFDPGFLYGQAVFETMRAYNRKIFRLDSHIGRLLASAARINITSTVTADVLKEAAARCLKENNLKDAYVRVTLWQAEEQETAMAVFAKSYNFLSEKDYQNGFKSVILQTFRQNEYSPLSGIKSANYLPLLLAYQEAKRRGADEALLLNTQGMLAEASRANIFLVKDNCLLTPSLNCGCLPGITRDTVLGIAGREKIKAIETKITPDDLKRADEAFLTNSLIEAMPLVLVDGKPIHKGTPGIITETIHKRYRQLL